MAFLSALAIAFLQVRVVKRIDDLETNLKLMILVDARLNLPVIIYVKWKIILSMQMSNSGLLLGRILPIMPVFVQTSLGVQFKELWEL